MPDTDDPSANEEHNLDDDIPESEEDGEGGWIDEEDDEDVEEDDHDGQRRPRSPDNGNEVSMVMIADNTGVNFGDEDYISGERDLDDEIPEGMDDSYQHTDTEAEDESSFEAEAEAEGEAEAEAQVGVLDRSVWGTGGEISGLSGSLPPPPSGPRGAASRRSGARMPGREN